MSEKKLPKTQQFDSTITNVIGPFINGNFGSLISAYLFSPSDLFHIIPSCDPYTDFFKFEPPKENMDSIQHTTSKRKKTGFWNRSETLFSSSPEPSCSGKSNKSNCRIGVRHTVAHFPAFEKETPSLGLPVGKEGQLYWIKPLQAELSKTGLSDGLFPIEIKAVFMLTFPNGNSGQAGYIDRIYAHSEYRRYHLYADGKQESAEIYSDQRLMHDLFRTIMGQLLLAEIYPQLYEKIRPLIRHIETKPLDGTPDGILFKDNVTDNVYPFAAIKPRNQVDLQMDDGQRCIRYR